MLTRRTFVAGAAGALLPLAPAVAKTPTSSGATSIAAEAFVYGYPLVMNYARFYADFLDEGGPAFKAPPNRLFRQAALCTPRSAGTGEPDCDAPSSVVGLDLRAEPMVIGYGAIEHDRYFSLHIVDLYTFSVGSVGSRTTGNAGGSVLVAGPRWSGTAPDGIDTVFRCETEFAIASFRTQLFGPEDMGEVNRIEATYKVQPLSAFLGQPAPPPARAIAWPKIDRNRAVDGLLGYLAFLLPFCPPVGAAAEEIPLREQFARVGIEAGQPFPAPTATQADPASIEAGAKIGLERISGAAARPVRVENGWGVSPGSAGDRAALHGNWLQRAAAAMVGLDRNDPPETLRLTLRAANDGRPPDTAGKRYSLTFQEQQFPPVEGFWSLSLYDQDWRLVANPLNRYVIGSLMLPALRRDADGSITLYIQKDSPGADREPNWLPAPDGPAHLVMRLYWPTPDALTGTWKPQPVRVAT